MKLSELWFWLKKGLSQTENGKIGLIFHIEKGKISVEKIHNTKGKVEFEDGEKHHA